MFCPNKLNLAEHCGLTETTKHRSIEAQRTVLLGASVVRCLLNNLDDLTGARINQHGPVIHNRIVIRVAQADAGWEWRQTRSQWRRLAHCHRFSNPE
jgi:hypothetical protein